MFRLATFEELVELKKVNGNIELGYWQEQDRDKLLGMLIDEETSKNIVSNGYTYLSIIPVNGQLVVVTPGVEVSREHTILIYHAEFIEEPDLEF